VTNPQSYSIEVIFEIWIVACFILVYEVPYSAILEFKLFVKECLTASSFVTYRAMWNLYCFYFHLVVSPHYLNVGSALGALEVFNDH
jgi:hypothetical protein